MRQVKWGYANTHTHGAGQVGLCKQTHTPMGQVKWGYANRPPPPPWGRSSGAMQTDTLLVQVKWGYANRHSFGTGQVGLCKQTPPPHGAGQVGLCKQTPPMGQVKWGYANRHSLGQVSHQATILWDRSRIEPVMLRIYLKDYAMLHCS